ncbi:MAG: DNA repair protein RadC [Ignavibacteria bacterium]|nr:MAG: DNA repair protein RadC [Ignavibacteria bacterium]KAF0161740.1 MAG: DNA repair protein RadC [Ignavibacteria bacterium]
MKVKELPFDDRPREKLILRGVQSLSNAELIAILLRTGTKGQSVIEVAQNLIKKYNDLNFLTAQTHDALTNFHGIGKDKAATLIAAFELSRRVDYEKKWLSTTKITSPKDVAEIFIPLLRDELKEQFLVVCLSSSNRIIKYQKISEGSLNSSVVHAREVFKVAIENSSANIILIHNHPSGNPEPSNEDISITRKLTEAGKLLEIQVFDHVIVAGDSYSSLVEKRII